VQLCRNLVVEHQDLLVVVEESVDVLERSVGRFRIEKVRDRDEREADNSPDDPKLVAEVCNAWRCAVESGKYGFWSG
jgi:hypothetical protein